MVDVLVEYQKVRGCSHGGSGLKSMRFFACSGVELRKESSGNGLLILSGVQKKMLPLRCVDVLAVVWALPVLHFKFMSIISAAQGLCNCVPVMFARKLELTDVLGSAAKVKAHELRGKSKQDLKSQVSACQSQHDHEALAFGLIYCNADHRKPVGSCLLESSLDCMRVWV